MPAVLAETFPAVDKLVVAVPAADSPVETFLADNPAVAVLAGILAAAFPVGSLVVAFPAGSLRIADFAFVVAVPYRKVL